MHNVKYFVPRLFLLVLISQPTIRSLNVKKIFYFRQHDDDYDHQRDTLIILT